MYVSVLEEFREVSREEECIRYSGVGVRCGFVSV
jgi:hypothetical protein